MAHINIEMTGEFWDKLAFIVGEEVKAALAQRPTQQVTGSKPTQTPDPATEPEKEENLPDPKEYAKMLRSKAIKVIQAGHRDEVTELVHSFAPTIDLIAPDRLPEFEKRLAEIGGTEQ